MNLTTTHSCIYIVDGQKEAIRNTLSFLSRAAGYATQTFATFDEFIDYAVPGIRGCLIMDTYLPTPSQTEFQRFLHRHGVDIPVIVLTTPDHIPAPLRSSRAGPIHFIAKPYDEDALLATVLEALDKDAAKLFGDSGANDVESRFQKLSRREKQVMALVVQGLSSKQIGKLLCISNRTVEVHREHIMHKMEASSVPVLISMGLLLGLSTTPAVQEFA